MLTTAVNELPVNLTVTSGGCQNERAVKTAIFLWHFDYVHGAQHICTTTRVQKTVAQKLQFFNRPVNNVKFNRLQASKWHFRLTINAKCFGSCQFWAAKMTHSILTSISWSKLSKLKCNKLMWIWQFPVLSFQRRQSNNSCQTESLIWHLILIGPIDSRVEKWQKIQFPVLESSAANIKQGRDIGLRVFKFTFFCLCPQATPFRACLPT